MLQCHHHRLLNEVSFDEATEVVSVDGEVRQLEGAKRSVQKRLVAAARTRHVRASQRDDGGAGVRDPPRQSLLRGCCHDTCSENMKLHTGNLLSDRPILITPFYSKNNVSQVRVGKA